MKTRGCLKNYRTGHRELEKLLEVGQTLAQKVTDDPGDVLETITTVERWSRAEHCVVIYPYDPQTHAYDVKYVKAYGLNEPLIPRETPRRDSGLSASIIKKGQLTVEDVETDEDVRRAKFINAGRFAPLLGSAWLPGTCPWVCCSSTIAGLMLSGRTTADHYDLCRSSRRRHLQQSPVFPCQSRVKRSSRSIS